MQGKTFAGTREKWLPLYAEFKKLARETLDDFTEHETASAVLWKHTSTFAEFSAKKDCMVIAFPAPAVHDEWESAKVLQTSANRAAHYFEITDAAQFSWFVERVGEAYQLTKPKNPTKQKTRDTAARQEYATVDEYIAHFPEDAREKLRQIRAALREALPDSSEKISWQMPTFYQGKNILHFAAFKKHVSIFPGPAAIEAFKNDLGDYPRSKGTIQFPLDKPLPLDIIKRIAEYCRENR